jgi:hypothetical protein
VLRIKGRIMDNAQRSDSYTTVTSKGILKILKKK